MDMDESSSKAGCCAAICGIWGLTALAGWKAVRRPKTRGGVSGKKARNTVFNSLGLFTNGGLTPAGRSCEQRLSRCSDCGRLAVARCPNRDVPGGLLVRGYEGPDQFARANLKFYTAAPSDNWRGWRIQPLKTGAWQSVAIAESFRLFVRRSRRIAELMAISDKGVADVYRRAQHRQIELGRAFRISFSVFVVFSLIL